MPQIFPFLDRSVLHLFLEHSRQNRKTLGSPWTPVFHIPLPIPPAKLIKKWYLPVKYRENAAAWNPIPLARTETHPYTLGVTVRAKSVTFCTPSAQPPVPKERNLG